VALAVFRRQFGWRMPYWADMRLDATALLFAGGLSVAAAVLAGLIPALRTARGDLTGMLRDESRGSTGTRAGRVMRGLVVVELALSVGLLAVTGLLIRGMGEASPERLGIPWRNVLTARIALPQDASAEVRLRYLASLEQTLSSQPAAAAVALATALPAARANVARIAIEGVTYESADAQPSVRRIAVSDGFFNLFDAAPTRGRAFGPLDGAAGTPVAIVNGALRRSLFSGEDPIGSRIRIGRTDGEPWRTIVGVIPDIWAGGLDAFPDRNPPAVYLPIAQAPPTTLGVAVRVRDTQPDGFANALRAASSAVDPDVPLYDVATMADLIENNIWFYGMAASIFALCGAATLLLATVGLYGVIAFSVGQRKREFGIRLALGAVPQDILRLVLRSGTVQLIAGIFLGAALARILSGGLSSLLFGVQPSDPLVLGVTLVLLSSVAITAMALPALRAGRTDPVTALRGE
jgi:predicted permease